MTGPFLESLMIGWETALAISNASFLAYLFLAADSSNSLALAKNPLTGTTSTWLRAFDTF